ncbi:hypothetical protein L7F22_029546 [Adiantum nelumboides]|nr:hypothetical protein [Adiantum nelumboides]
MGGTISYAAGPPPPPPLPLPPPPTPTPPPPPSSPDASTVSTSDEKDENQPTDWLNLPCPVAYDELQREAYTSLKPELFEGLRFDFTRPLTQKFSLSHSLSMGVLEVPSQTNEIFKVSTSHYEFGANFLDTRCMLIGRLLTDGRMSARMKYDLTENFSVKVNAQLTNEPHFSQGMFNFDYKGRDFRTQLQLGNNAFYGANYIQSISPKVALGGEIFWLGHQRKSGLGLAARYNTDKSIATCQLASTGMLAMNYVQKISDKVAIATDFLYNSSTRESVCTLGYDYLFRHCRLRGRLDSNGCAAAYLEERMNLGVNFILSAEIDHWKKDYKFGFGMTVGEL